ncbi:hypothetical protein VYU27_003557 [Nannochloropsis oceanica]
MAENGGGNAMGEVYDPFAQPYIPPPDPAVAVAGDHDQDDEQHSATHPWGPMNDAHSPAAAVPTSYSLTFQGAHRERSKSPPRPSGVSGATIDHKGKRLYVGQLSFDTTDEELRAIFTKIGPLRYCKIMTDKGTTNSRGFGFVGFSTREAAQEAIDRWDNQEFKGRRMKLRFAEPKAGEGDGGGGGGGGAEREGGRDSRGGRDRDRDRERERERERDGRGRDGESYDREREYRDRDREWGGVRGVRERSRENDLMERERERGREVRPRYSWEEEEYFRTIAEREARERGGGREGGRERGLGRYPPPSSASSSAYPPLSARGAYAADMFYAPAARHISPPPPSSAPLTLPVPPRGGDGWEGRDRGRGGREREREVYDRRGGNRGEGGGGGGGREGRRYEEEYYHHLLSAREGGGGGGRDGGRERGRGRSRSRSPLSSRRDPNPAAAAVAALPPPPPSSQFVRDPYDYPPSSLPLPPHSSYHHHPSSTYPHAAAPALYTAFSSSALASASSSSYILPRDDDYRGRGGRSRSRERGREGGREEYRGTRGGYVAPLVYDAFDNGRREGGGGGREGERERDRDGRGGGGERREEGRWSDARYAVPSQALPVSAYDGRGGGREGGRGSLNGGRNEPQDPRLRR